MRVDINQNGILTIQSETPLEAYALGKWIEENLKLVEENSYTSSKENFWMVRNMLTVISHEPLQIS